MIKHLGIPLTTLWRKITCALDRHPDEYRQIIQAVQFEEGGFEIVHAEYICVWCHRRREERNFL